MLMKDTGKRKRFANKMFIYFYLYFSELFEEDEDILISKIQQKNQERLEKSRFYWGNAALHQRIENSQNPNSNNQRVIKGLSRALRDDFQKKE